MTFTYDFRPACLIAALALTPQVHAELLTSSASSAGSAASGSVSDSLSGLSGSSRDQKETAEGDYRITDVARATGRAGILRVTMQADGSQEGIVLDLPSAVMEQQGLGRGDLVRAERRVYGLEFARADTHEAFFLVLADDWHRELVPQPVASL